MTIALVGNQNSGKTTLFNLLTNSNAKIGNWPGVTIEKKIGIIKGTKHQLVDLPGIYSLSPYSIEEEISRKYIFKEKPDIIINIIDATSLERSLYLTTQLLELDCNIIVALNMADILAKKGLKIDTQKLEQLLGTPVIQISALKNTGIDTLIEKINKPLTKINKPIYDKNIEISIAKLEKLLKKDLPHKRFTAIKLLESDYRFQKYNTNKITKEIMTIQKSNALDLEELIATERYKYIEKIKSQTLTKQKTKTNNITDKLDKIFLNKYLAFPIFILIMFLVYYLSVGVVGSYTVDFIAELTENFGTYVGDILEKYHTSSWLISLVVDGIIAGVEAVLGFIPQLIILFTCIVTLETTGYMSRISLLLDKFFRKVGLSGKSLIPFIVGSGCSVPGIMGSRIIENPDEREMTTILTPFIPCSAKLPVIALFSGYFFPTHSGLISASLYFLAIIIIIISSLLLKKFIYKHTSSTYIAELPDYKLPSLKYIIKDVVDKIIAFIKRAGSIIVICSIAIWFLLSFSFDMTYGVEIEKSMLADIGRTISWLFVPMLGTNSWGATVSAIQGLIAKEQVISSMSIIAGLAEDVEEGSKIFAQGTTFSFFTASSAYAFMVFNLFSAPCLGAIGAMRRELGGTKKMLRAVIFQTIIAWFLATVVYQIGSRIENGTINVANLVVIGIIILLVIAIILKRKQNNCTSCPYCNSCNKQK